MELTPLMREQALANRYINRTWLKALEGLSLEELDRPQGAFWGSIFATWNHILLGDRIWLSRVQGQPHAYSKLGERICPTLESLHRERERTDTDLIAAVESERDFARVVSYQNTAGVPGETPLYQILAHLFAHQSHHRGQIHQMCDERGIKLPDGGLIGFYRSPLPAGATPL